MLSERSVQVAVGAVVASALVGGVYGRSAQAQSDRVDERYKVFSAAVAAIEGGYVEPVQTDRLVYGAITGMLQTLDPHSSFFDPKTYAQLRERQEGRYYGLGITIQVVEDDITVVSLFEGSPAYKKGIRRSDVIAEIEGESTKGWTTDQAVQKLKGPKGTAVKIGVRRKGFAELVRMEVVRDEIAIPTILGAFMVDDRTGYIRLRDFSETTDRELGRSLDDLQHKGMKRLVLDLRDNPGGPLDQAIRVSSRFLRRGEMVVYTRGRVQNSDQDFRANEGGAVSDVPVVVLVNRNSASAAEIVTGALQDHDRALIVGETTFGKALVQSVYRISQGAGLALTTARYYTPSGRMIQRPWDGTFDEYLTYGLRDQQSERQHAEADQKATDSGRKVYSGGGVEPDRFVPGPVEGFNPSRFGRSLYGRQAFENFATRFVAEGDTRSEFAGANANRRALPHNFVVDDGMVNEFREFLKSQHAPIDAAAFDKDIDFIRAMIHYQIDIAIFSIDEARRNLVARDPQTQAALGAFADAEALLRQRGTATASRAQRP
ncbi:MAG: S41 family peptidase [Vicinamibacterales bacterium]